MGVGRNGLTNSADGLLKKKDNEPRSRRNTGNDRDGGFGFEPSEVQEGLVQIPGTPYFTTPNKPADPRDCSRYPNSPYCGGGGFNLDNALDLGLNIVLDECNIGIEAAPTLAFISLPTFQFVYRKHGACRLPPPPPEPIPNEAPACVALRVTGVNPDDDTLSIVFRNKYSEYREGAYGDSRLVTITVDITSLQFLTQGFLAVVEFSVSTLWIDELGDPNFTPFTEEDDQSKSTIQYARYGVINDGGNYTMQYIGGDALTSTVLCRATFGLEAHYSLVNSVKNNLDFIRCSEGYEPLSNSKYAFTLPDPENPPPLTLSSSIRGFSVDPLPYGTFFGVQWVYTWEGFYFQNYQSTVKVFNSNFGRIPPPPPEEKCKCMCRCTKNEPSDFERLILKRIGNLPAKVPTRLTDRQQGMTNINSLSEFIAHTIRQIDAVTGYFPLSIEIEDTDLTKAGNQSKTIKLPNISETLAEILGLLLAVRTESDANLNATMRTLIEVGSTKTTAVQTYYATLANAEYLSYKQKHIEKEVPFTFTPGKEKLDEILKEAKVKVRVIDNDDQDDIKKLVYPLLEMAARWNAQNYRNVGTSNPKSKLEQLLGIGSLIGDAADIYAKTQQGKNPDGTPKPPKKDDFDNFLEHAENGFNTQDSIQDPKSAYGYPLSNRPKFRELGNTSDNQ